LCEKKGYGDNNPFGVCCADSGFANEFIFGGEVSAVVRLKPKQGENVLCDERSRQARWSSIGVLEQGEKGIRIIRNPEVCNLFKEKDLKTGCRPTGPGLSRSSIRQFELIRQLD
jgi:hypothetical protein